jgi:divalent metal cation (Fe/Co/Zn/Cd) transporter
MAANSSSTQVIYAALAGNLLVAFTKAGAAAWTGSSAMLSEAVHSFVDIGNQLLLLYGMRRATLRADQDHPIGYGRELYFWSFIVALLVFALGAVVAIYHGVLHVRNPEPVHDAYVNYVVLGLSDSRVRRGGSLSGTSGRSRARSATTRHSAAARTRLPSWACSRTARPSSAS